MTDLVAVELNRRWLRETYDTCHSHPWLTKVYTSARAGDEDYFVVDSKAMEMDTRVLLLRTIFFVEVTKNRCHDVLLADAAGNAPLYDGMGAGMGARWL